jgi:PAS domain S-box-containing protein
MTEKNRLTGDLSVEENEHPSFLELGDNPTETIDLDFLFQMGRNEPAGSESKKLKKSAVGKILQALPIPALLVDQSYSIVFANRSCRKISVHYETILQAPFSSLFSDADSVRKAQSLIETVFATRKPQVAKGALRIEKGSLWGRIHMRSLRVGQERLVVAFVEDLAPNRKQLLMRKKQLRLNKKHEDELRRARSEFETRLAEHSAQLTEINDLLEQETTGRARFAEALDKSERLLDTVLESAPTGLCFLEGENLKWANAAMSELFRNSGEAAWARSGLSDLLASADELNRVRRVVVEGLSSDGLADTETEFKRTDGSTFRGNLRVVAMQPQSPEKGLVASISEIPFEQQNHQGSGDCAHVTPSGADKESHTNFMHGLRNSDADPFKNASILTVVVDLGSWEIRGAFGPVEQILNYKPEALAGNPFTILQHPEKEWPDRNTLERLWVHGDSICGQTLLAGDGSAKTVDLTATLIPWYGRSAAAVTLREPTNDSSRGEMPEESRHGRQPLLDGCPVGLVACDAQGTGTDLNTRAETALGASGAGAREGLNLLSHPGLVEAGLASVIGKCLESGDPVVCEFPKTAGLGDMGFARVHVEPMRGDNGKVTGAQAALVDVSDQKRSEKVLLQSARFRAVGEMAGGVANSLNTMLQAVAGGSRKALGYLESNNYGKIRPLLEQIFDSTRQAVDTVRRLQQFATARRRAGVSTFSQSQREVFDITEAVREAVETREIKVRISEKKGVAISFDLDLTDGCFIEGEESEIVEVLVNLLANAEEALPVGGRIGVKTYLKKDQVILEVRDNGVGIPETNAVRVFEPFWTTKESHAGMGLTVNFAIIRRHRGTITVKSTKRRGTTFTVKLPGAKRPAKRVEALADHVRHQSYRILLIDDEEAIVRIFEKGLRKLGQTPITAFSGPQGLKMFEETEVDAVVCDLAMPGMNGWEVGRGIHELCVEKGIPKPPFIMLTGWAGQLADDEIHAHPDIDRIVEKPLKVPRLLEIVAKEIRRALTDAAFYGRVDGIDILEYMQLVMLSGKPLVVDVKPTKGIRGRIFLNKGQICHATCGELQGEEAVYHCLNFEGGSFSNLPWRDPDEITIDKPGEYVLIEAARRRDEIRRDVDGNPVE